MQNSKAYSKDDIEGQDKFVKQIQLTAKEFRMNLEDRRKEPVLDALKNTVQVGDLCARIHNYNTLVIVHVSKITERRCTFSNGGYDEHSAFISLDSIGIKNANSFYGTFISHWSKDHKDALGNELKIGDAVVFISSNSVRFAVGTVKKLPDKRVSIIVDCDDYGRPSDTKAYSRFYSDVISLSAYGLEDLKTLLYTSI